MPRRNFRFLPVHFLWFKNRLAAGIEKKKIADEFVRRFGGNKATVRFYLSKYFPKGVNPETALWQYRNQRENPEQRRDRALKASASLTPEQRRDRALKASYSRRNNLVGSVIYVEKLPTLNYLTRNELNAKFREFSGLIENGLNRFRRRPDFEDVQGVVNVAVITALSKWDRQMDLRTLVVDSIKLHLIDYFGQLKKWRIKEIPISFIDEFNHRK